MTSASNKKSLEALCEMMLKLNLSIANGVKEGFMEEYKEIDAAKATTIVNDVMSKISDKQVSVFTGNPVKQSKIVEGGCSFMLVRGPRQGQSCSKPCVKGFKFCSTHKNSIERRSGKRLSISMSDIIGNVPFTPINDLVENTELFRYGNTPLLVMRENFNKPVSQSNCEVVGRLNSYSYKMDNLSEEDKVFAAKEGLVIAK